MASPAADAARSALATLDWLRRHGYSHLVSDAVIVTSSPRPGPLPIDIGKFAGHFLSRVRAVHFIPFDRHLAEGAEVSLELMSRNTRQAFMGLAATIADGFGNAAQQRTAWFEPGRAGRPKRRAAGRGE